LPLVAVLLLAAVLSALVSGCGGSSTKTTKTSAATAAAATNAAATSKASSNQGGGVSGKWSGQYGGAYSGRFNLHWIQSGSGLRGTIKLSAPANTLAIHGTLNGGAIKFGTVGSVAITYTGTVSGSSMSGSYNTPGGGGSWSANKG
jgi:type II secretory pathway pseudopilin PulG